MKLISHTSLFAVLVSLASISSVCVAKSSTCFSNQNSTVGVAACLQRELETVDSELNKKTSQLISAVSKSSAWSTNPQMAKDYKASLISMIQQADKQWRALAKLECEILSAQSTGGSGEGNSGLACLISRTRVRITFIQEHEIYKYHWGN